MHKIQPLLLICCCIITGFRKNIISNESYHFVYKSLKMFLHKIVKYKHCRDVLPTALMKHYPKLVVR